MGSEVLFYYIYKYFVVARRQRAGHAVCPGRIHQAVAEAVAPRLVLFGVAVEVLPQHRREDKFGVHRRLQQLAEGRTAGRIECRQIPQGEAPGEVKIAAKADQHDALAVLGQKVLAVDDLRIVRPHLGGVGHIVAEIVEGLHDDAEGFAAVVAFEVFNVLQHEDGRAAGIDDAGNVKKECALGIAGETVGAAEGVLLRHAGQGKGLAREAREQHVVPGHNPADVRRRLGVADFAAVAEGNAANILVKLVRVRVAVPVGAVGAHRVLVPFAGEHALAADGLEAAADPADAGEEIDKAKGVIRMMGGRRGQQLRQPLIFALAEAAVDFPGVDCTLENGGRPVLLACGQQFSNQRSDTVDSQQRVKQSPGVRAIRLRARVGGKGVMHIGNRYSLLFL